MEIYFDVASSVNWNDSILVAQRYRAKPKHMRPPLVRVAGFSEQAAGFGDAEDFGDFAAFDDFAGGAALAIEPGHEVLQAHLVFFLGLENQHFDGAETVGGDAAAFEFEGAGDGFEERGGFDFDDVGAALNVGEGDAAVAFGHGEVEVSIFAFSSP